MTDLLDRLSGLDDTRPKINLHRFIGVERLYAMGEFSRTQIATEFNFQGAEITQATQIADNIDSKITLAEKVVYIARVESVCMCLEDALDTFYHSSPTALNKPKCYEDLQITG